MNDLRHLDPDLRETLCRTLLDPSTLTVRPEVLQTAIVALQPHDIKRLVTWQKCLDPTPANDHVRRQMNRLADGRRYRQSVLPTWKRYRKVDFGDGLTLLFAIDHPAVNAFMRRVMPATGVHEPELVFYLRQTVRRGDLVVDIGAHVGYVSCVVGALGAAVLAVEMQPTLIPMIQLNAWANDIWSVHTLCAAISDRTGLVPSLRVSPSPGLQATVGQWERGQYPLNGQNHDLIPTLTLDDLFPQAPYPKLVKVDVEGAEGRVLAGASRMIAAAATIFMVEVHAHLLHFNKHTLADILERFPEDRWALSILTASGAEPLSRQSFLDPEGPVVRPDRNAPVLFEPRSS